jgi:enoyl-[acyl-carrier protein] reductase II
MDVVKTEVCEILGVEYPILCGGMVWVSDASLASAVSEAGGLGVIAAASFTNLDDLREEIRKVRSATKKPFGVNFPIFYPQIESWIDTGLEEGIKICVTSAGPPERFTEKLKNAGCIVLHVAPTPRLAKKAEDAGVDIVIAEGIEAGGHNSPFEIPTFTLIPQIVDTISIPVVAAGGIYDARGFVAAIALGAKGIQMGTRFILTKECTVHENFKNAILKAGPEDTILLGRTFRRPTRCLLNKLAQELSDLELKGERNSVQADVVGPAKKRKAIIEGDIEDGLVMTGQVAGGISEIKSVKQVIDEIVDGARNYILKRS